MQSTVIECIGIAGRRMGAFRMLACLRGPQTLGREITFAGTGMRPQRNPRALPNPQSTPDVDSRRLELNNHSFSASAFKLTLSTHESGRTATRALPPVTATRAAEEPSTSSETEAVGRSRKPTFSRPHSCSTAVVLRLRPPWSCGPPREQTTQGRWLRRRRVLLYVDCDDGTGSENENARHWPGNTLRKAF